MAAPQGVNFDGTNDYLTRDADLTGNADSKLWTCSFWCRSTSIFLFIYANSGTFVQMFLTTGGNIELYFENSSSTTICDILSTGGGLDDGEWHHVCASFDLSDSAKRHLFVDDLSDLSASTYVDDTIKFTANNHGVGATHDGQFKYNGDLADFWFAPGQYVDLSVEANRRKFIGSAAATSVDLGSDGSTPTGVAPLIYLHGPTATWHTNDGTGEGFTENGALTDASSNPPDYPPTVTASINAILKRQDVLLTASLDALLVFRREQIAEISAVLQAAQTLSTNISVALAERTTRTTSVSAALQASLETTAQMDAALQVVRSAVAQMDTALQAQFSKAVSVDALLVNQQALTTSISAALQSARSAVAQMDAVLHAQLSKTTSIDARLVNLRTATASINAILLRQIQKTASINAALRDSFTASATMDALLRTGFWQADDEGNGNWRKTPDGNGLWVKAPNTSTGWGNA